MTALKKLHLDDLTDTIQQLAYRDHARLRNEMLLGSRAPHTQTILSLKQKDSLFINLNDDSDGLSLSEETWIPALATFVREITDNALDEFSHGFGDKLEVTYNKDTFDIAVKDNGRGIPFDKALIALTQPMTGRNFGVRQEVVGTNGYGASIVSNTSEYFNFTIWRDGKKVEQSITEGDPSIGCELEISPPVITPNSGRSSGTLIEFKPSKHVFKHRIFPENYLKTRLFEIAACNPKYKIYYNGELLKIKPQIEKSLFPNHKSIPIDISDESQNFRSRFWLVPNFVESGDHSHSIVNNIFTPNGGAHIDTFKKLFPVQLLNILERESRRRKLSPNRSDVIEGLLIYNITNMRKPDFDSQSKTRLINEEVAEIIKKYVENEEFIKSLIRDNKDFIESIYQRCADRTQKKDASEVAKLSKKILRNKVPGLMDAVGTRRNDCILFLAEGESAVSGITSVRNPDLHGGLGLRGKIMNVNGENPKKILDNKCLTEIMNSVGLVIGQKAQRHNLRYGKIYIATDSDPDGGNITALLINFFHTYWPELFDKTQRPFIFAFQTPFIIAEKGKQRKYWYAYNYSDFKPSEWHGWIITRAKGLGTLTEDDWRHSLQEPVAIPLIDNGDLRELLDLIFNAKRSDDRKIWMAS